MTGSENVAPQLTDGVVLLDEYRPSDAEAHLAGEDDEHARRFGWYPKRSTRETVQKAIERWRHDWISGGSTRAFAVRLLSTGGLVGGCELRVRGNGEASISYWTFPLFRRRGYATRAVLLTCRYAFEYLVVQRIELWTDPDNYPSRAVAQRTGFIPQEISGDSPPEERTPGSVRHLLRRIDLAEKE